MVKDYLCTNRNTDSQKEFCFLCPIKNNDTIASSAVLNKVLFIPQDNTNARFNNTITLFDTYSNSFTDDSITQQNIIDTIAILRLEQKMQSLKQQIYVQEQCDIIQQLDLRNKNRVPSSPLYKNLLNAGAYCGAEYLACEIKNDISLKADREEIKQSEKNFYLDLVDGGKTVVQDLSKKIIDKHF